MSFYKKIIITVCMVIIGGCSAQKFSPYNNTKNGEHKGYVDFIKNDPQKVLRYYRGGWSIDRIENGVQLPTRPLDSETRYVRFTESPGKHQFFVDLGWTVEHIEVDVIENMVTPIKITITPSKHDKEIGRVIEAHFYFDVLDPEKP